MIHELDRGESQPIVEIRTYGESKTVYITDCDSFESIIIPYNKLGDFVETITSVKVDLDAREGL